MSLTPETQPVPHDIQARNLINLLRTGAFQFADEKTPWFPYTSGQIGPYYVQSISIEKDGEAYAEAIKSLVKMIQSESLQFDAISGGETRDWDFSNPLAYVLKKPHVKLYKDGRALGAEITGRRVLHVSDLNNEGSSVRDYWKPSVERHGGRLIALLSFVDRMEDGYAMLKNIGLPVISVVPLNERAWNIALEQGLLSHHVHRALTERIKDKHDWAVRSLLEHPDHFRALFRDPGTRDKAVKIMRAYPEIKADLHDMIKDLV